LLAAVDVSKIEVLMG